MLLCSTFFSGVIPYTEDPFGRKRELDKKELQEHYAKLQEKPFSQKVKGRDTFQTHKDAYGEDRVYVARKPVGKRLPLMTHEYPFKPSHPPRKGYNKTLDKFPEYKEDPMRAVERKKVAGEQQEEQAKWRHTHRLKSKPTPSVVTSFRNLKSEFPSVYRRM